MMYVYCKYSISISLLFEKKYKIRENLIKFNTHKIRLRLKACLLLVLFSYYYYKFWDISCQNNFLKWLEGHKIINQCRLKIWYTICKHGTKTIFNVVWLESTYQLIKIIFILITNIIVIILNGMNLTSISYSKYLY